MGPAELVAFYRTPNLRALAPNRFSIVRAREQYAKQAIVAYGPTEIPCETFPGKEAIFVTTVFCAFIFKTIRKPIIAAGTRYTAR